MVPARTTIKVPTMSCEGCVSTVRQALENVEGVFAAEVSLEKKEADVSYDSAQVPEQMLHSVIEESGYKTEKGMV